MELKYVEYPVSCPPEEAANISGIYYRLCESYPPKLKDFRTPFDLGVRPKQNNCDDKALSFSSDINPLVRLQKQFPSMKKKKILKFELVAEMGVSEYNQNSKHLNLWEYRDVDWLALVKDNVEEVSL